MGASVIDKPRQRSTDHWYNNGGMTLLYRAALGVAVTIMLTWLWESKAVVSSIQTALTAIDRRLDAQDRRMDTVEERIRYVERRDK